MVHRKLEFPAKDQQEFMIELRAKVAAYFESNKLSKYGNFNLAFKTVFMLLLFLAPYVLMISGLVSSLAGVLGCWIIIGVGTAGVGMGVMHDANHGTFSKNKNTNRLFGMTLYLLGGFPPNWKYQHNTMHHGFTNIEGYDEDIAPGFYLRISPHRPLLKIHKYQHIYAWFLYGLMTLSWVIAKDFVQLNDYRKEGVKLMRGRTYNQLFGVLILSKIIYYSIFMLVPILVLPFAWYWVIIFFVAMHFTSGFILTTVFQTAHVVPTSEYPLPDEDGSMENSWAVHQACKDDGR